MDFALGLVVMLLGFTSAFFSGLLGIGGGITMIPLLLFVLPALGFEPLDMRFVAGLSMVQVLFSALSGVIVHHRNRFVSRELVLYMGSGSLMGSLMGGIASGAIPSRVLSTVFACLTLVGIVMMLLPARDLDVSASSDEVRFNRVLAFLIALMIGTMAGMVGVGGAFILVPLMLYVLKVPIRTTIGSALGIVLLGAMAGSVGKISTGQVIYWLAGAAVIGALPGAQVGGLVSRRLQTGNLRRVLVVVLAAVAAKMWYDLLAGG